jgi:peptide/nickel transport system ATP-binding protein
VPVVDGVSFSIEKGETLGIVGESGSGKTMAALSVMRLLANTSARVVDGEVCFEGEDLLAKSEPEMRTIRGNRIAMIYQEPMSSLNPVFTIGQQIMEAILLHQRVSRRVARDNAVSLLRTVGIAAPEARLDFYPHQLSGGMRQRVMIAMALSCNPTLLIADEPTTALDVTVQAEILDLLRRLKQDFGMAMMLITHDLGIVAEAVNRVVVMYSGRIVETAPTETLFRNPQHPYSVGLLSSIPRLDEDRERLNAIDGTVPNPGDPPPGCRFHPRCVFARDICRRLEPPLLDVEASHLVRCWRNTDFQPDCTAGWTTRFDTPDQPTPRDHLPAAAAAGRGTEGTSELLRVSDLVKHFPTPGGWGSGRRVVRAVDGVSFHIDRGETLALVGESGCGKSTTGRMILRLIAATSGEIWFKGREVQALSAREMRRLRKSMQIVFQDPFESLNPRMTVERILREPLKIHRVAAARDQRDRVAKLLELVGLSAHYMTRYPHEFSGGERQRVGVARALASGPDIIVCDEPVSALDVSIQAQILNLLRDLQKTSGVAYLFIAHDLSVVRHIADRVAVMYLGKVVEIAPKQALFARPQHPYTEALLSAIPVPSPAMNRRRIILRGEIPSAVAPPTGCRFRTRCLYAAPICATDEPPLLETGEQHLVACHFRTAVGRGPVKATDDRGASDSLSAGSPDRAGEVLSHVAHQAVSLTTSHSSVSGHRRDEREAASRGRQPAGQPGHSRAHPDAAQRSNP